MRTATTLTIFIVGILLILGIVGPGPDVLLWHVLAPTGFWQKIAFIGIDLITVWPRVLIELFCFGTLAGVVKAVRG